MGSIDREGKGKSRRGPCAVEPESAPESSPHEPANPGVDYRTIFDCIADAVLVVDRATHRFLDCNRTALEQYGYTREELLTKTPYDLHLAEDRELVDSIIDKPHRRSGHTYHHRTRDGFLMDVEIRSEAVEYDGRPAWLAIVREIGDRLRREEELRRAKDEAERASRAKSEFLARMSHEIRTPMNGVIGMSEVLQAGPLSVDQKECVTTIQNCATSLLTVIDDILDFSRIEQGRLQLSLAPLDLPAVVEAAVDPVALRAAQKGLELVVDVGVEVPSGMVGDAVRIRQILTNLAGNAVKFTTRGHVVVRVRRDLERGAAPGGFALRFEVSDTGCGIPAAQQRAVFDPFVQVDDFATRRAAGTGLGLAISRQLVELMGGSVGVQSVEGEGSTFWFTLELPLAGDGTAGARAPADLPGARVLLVGLCEPTQRMLARRLHAWSARAVAAAPSSAANVLRAAAAAHEPYGVLLLDEASCEGEASHFGVYLSQLRAAARAERTAIVLLTPPGPRDAARDAAAAGLPTLSKPIRLAALEQKLRAALRGTSSGAAALRPSGSVAAHRASGSIPTVRPSGSAPAIDHTPLRRGGRPVRVLLAEDNPVNRRVIAFMLEAWGVQIECVEDGAAAVARSAAEAFDLVLMDWQMPGMDGRQATEAIRAREQGRAAHVPIIGLTANAMQGDRQRCLDAGMDDYLPKPFRAPQLRALLEHWTATLA